MTWPLGSIDPRLYKLTSDNDDDDYDPPDNHIGRVWFGVKYEAQSEKLLVALVKAKNLVSRVNLLVSRVYLLVSRVYPLVSRVNLLVSPVYLLVSRVYLLVS